MPRLAACLCTALSLAVCLPSGALAQLVANCQTTSTPLLFPFIADGTTADNVYSLNGWASDTDFPTAHATFAVGDVDGDGNDELVSMPSYTALSSQQWQIARVQVSHWNQTGWTPMASISNATLLSNLSLPAGLAASPNNPSITIQLSQFEVHLADVDGDGQKEVVARLMGSVSSSLTSVPTTVNFDQEEVYHYNTAIKTWTLLTTYATGGNSAMWMKAHSTDTQEVRITLDNSQSLPQLNAATWANGKWNPAPYSPIAIKNEKFATGCAHGLGLTGYCVAFGDVTGDGLADLVYVGNDENYSVYIRPSGSGKPFGGTETFAGLQVHTPLTNPQNWQVGDIDGDGISEMIFTDSSEGLEAFYWDSNKNLFESVLDPNAELGQTGEVLGPFSALEILSKPIITNNYDQSGNNPTPGPSMGVAAIGKSGVYVLKFSSTGGQHTFPGVYDFSDVPELTSAISATAGFAPSGYSGYFRFAVEGQNMVMLARASNGIVNMVPSGTAFVDPNTLTDRGYPAYTTSQQAAYLYIGVNAAQNPDIRSLYTDPAVPWSPIQYQVETLAPPPASSGISASDFQFVQKQTVNELTALQSVNLFYGVTGQILTNTYLVKDAALSEVTDALNLAAAPDVTAQTLNILTSILGGLGGIIGEAGQILSLAENADKLKTIISVINQANYVVSVMSSITGDGATYAPGTAPGDTATGTFDLKTALDSTALGQTTANACHQLEALSAWNQSKPIADGILTGALPLDLETQQDLLQAGQSLYRMDVWQTLAPTKWNYLAIWGQGKGVHVCNNCLYPGSASFPLADSVQAKLTCQPNGRDSLNIYNLVLEDATNHNWPNINALNAMFNAPPVGLGVSPSDVFFGNNGWSFQYAVDPEFSSNTGYSQPDTRNYTGCSFQPVAPPVTPNLRPVTPRVTSNLGGEAISSSVDPGRESAGARLEKLMADVKSNLTDANLRDRLVTFLDAANSRLVQARQRHNKPTETIRLLNLFIAQSQWHADHDSQNGEFSRTQSIEAVGIRDSLLESMKFDAKEVASAR